MDTSIAATVDRLKRLKAGEPLSIIYGVTTTDAGQWWREQDERCLARQYLADGDTANVLRAALRKLASYAATCSVENTPEWMAGLVERLNEGLAAIGEADRVEWWQRNPIRPGEIRVVRAGEVPS